MIALAIALCGAGHLVRDGQPDFKTMLSGTLGTRWAWLYHLSTQFARAAGGIAAIVAALVVGHSPLLGLAVWLGFYSDQKHGEGQSATTLKDAAYLTLSGITSLVPLACVAAWLHGWPYLAICLVGIVKPAIWFGWWRTPVQKIGPWFEPTRFAAITFGCIVGALIVVL